SRIATPSYAIGSDYSINYQLKNDTLIDAHKGITQVYDMAGGKGYVFNGTNGKIHLPTQNYATDTANWTPNTSVTLLSVDASTSDEKYRSTLENFTLKHRDWTTGGGWLRTKTIHTEIT